MKLTMRIENLSSLDGGAPLEYVADGDGFEAGRNPALNWWLPDETRFISSRHFEVTYRGGIYYITDCSTNGTFKVGETNRIVSPLQLYGGERFQVGEYVVEVTLGEAAAPGLAPAAPAAAGGGDDPWSVGAGAPPPVPVNQVVPDQSFRPSFDDEFIQTGPAPIAAPAAPTGLGASTPPPGLGAPLGTPPGPAPAPAAPFQQSIPPAPAQFSGGGADILAAILQGAGLPATQIQGDPTQIAMEIGQSLRILTEGLMEMLHARAQAKTFVKSSSRTMMSFDDNNPMKFLPDAGQAIETMFFNKRQGFLDGAKGFEDAIGDVKDHQAGVYAAIQPALARLIEDLSPEAIEARKSKGVLGSKRAANWETYVERWDAKTLHHENGMLDVFLTYFADEYDKATNSK